MCILFTAFVQSSIAYAADPIRVGSFSSTRTRWVLTTDTGAPPHQWDYTTRLYYALINDTNFGASGVVECPAEIGIPYHQITNGDLVDSEGNLRYDIFFATAIDTDLADHEAEELSRFVINGGVLYVGGYGWSDNTPGKGPEYNLLFEKLGIADKFLDDLHEVTGITQSSDANESIVVNGPFGVVKGLNHGPFREFERFSIRGVVSSVDGGNIVNEINIGEGYLIVDGGGLFVDTLITDVDNSNYFKNLFALGCGEQDFGKYEDNSVVLDVPSFKQGLLPYDNSDPIWENIIYDHGDELDLWCDTNGDFASMAECACALTSASMVSNYLGFTKTPGGQDLDPAFLNLYAREVFPTGGTSGFVSGNFRWSFISNLSAQAYQLQPDQQKIDLPVRENYDLNRVKTLIDEGTPVILKVLSKWGDHWVVVKGYDAVTSRLIINDPAQPDQPTGQTYLDDRYTPYETGSMIVYRPTNSDFRYLEFATHSDNHLLFTDSEGNKTGYDASTGSEVSQIPNSEYLFDAFYGDATSSLETLPPTEGIRSLIVKLPANGEYTMEVTNESDANNEVYAYSSNVSGNMNGLVVQPVGVPSV